MGRISLHNDVTYYLKIVLGILNCSAIMIYFQQTCIYDALSMNDVWNKKSWTDGTAPRVGESPSCGGVVPSCAVANEINNIEVKHNTTKMVNIER